MFNSKIMQRFLLHTQFFLNRVSDKQDQLIVKATNDGSTLIPHSQNN